MFVPLASQQVCYLVRLADCNRSGGDREGDIDWQMSYAVTVLSLNPTLPTNYCSMSGCDREGGIDWHMFYTVTVLSLNPTQSNMW